MEDYVISLVDPFDTEILQPKLLDGRVPRSSGIRLRSTGEIACDPAGITYIALIPGLSNTICWNTSPSTVTNPAAFSGHVGSATDRAFVKNIRLVSAGLRLSLVNSALENEGYWEAARIPVSDLDFTIDATTGVLNLPLLDTGIDLANHQTYQTGNCRDLFRFQFKINSLETQHPFGNVLGSPTIANFSDNTFDMVIIKVHGRNVSLSPSVLKYDCISNQEVVYVENTALSRLMTRSPRLGNFPDILDRTSIPLPALQTE
jgi:hypothetical protein